MALTEEQIVRFSRQILLREVGGRGQLRLCQTPIRVAGAPEVAVWLGAGGSPIAASSTDRLVGEQERGFAGEAGAPLGQALARFEVSPAEEPAGVEVRAVGAGASSSPVMPTGGLVLVGMDPEGGKLAIAFAGGSACAGCLARTVQRWGPPPGDWGGLGAPLAALAAQRLVLGHEPSEGVLGLDDGGLPGALRALARCEAHG